VFKEKRRFYQIFYPANLNKKQRFSGMNPGKSKKKDKFSGFLFNPFSLIELMKDFIFIKIADG
jgi:hypothetical protein